MPVRMKSKPQEETTLPSGATVQDMITNMGLSYLSGRAVELIQTASVPGPFGPRVEALDAARDLLAKERRHIISTAPQAKPRKARKPRSDAGKSRKAEVGAKAPATASQKPLEPVTPQTDPTPQGEAATA